MVVADRQDLDTHHVRAIISEAGPVARFGGFDSLEPCQSRDEVEPVKAK